MVNCSLALVCNTERVVGRRAVWLVSVKEEEDRLNCRRMESCNALKSKDKDFKLNESKGKELERLKQKRRYS